MVDGRLLIYAIALLVLIAAAVFSAVRFFAARRQHGHGFVGDDDERPLHDIPLLFRPRPVTPVFIPDEPVRPASPGARNGASLGKHVPNQAATVAVPRPMQEITSPTAADELGTMQLLPGRLEPVNDATHQEIRFVKVPGVTRFTFGRSPGPAYEHVQLRNATASRMHGYMVFEDGRWRIGNLSDTNRVIVNGAPLMEETARLLEDGDQIEFGEVAFVFRER